MLKYLLCTFIVCNVQIIDSDEKREKLVDVDSPKRTHSQSHYIGGIAVFDVTQFTVSSIIGYSGVSKMDYFCLQVTSLYLLSAGIRSSVHVVEHLTADEEVPSSNLGTPSFFFVLLVLLIRKYIFDKCVLTSID